MIVLLLIIISSGMAACSGMATAKTATDFEAPLSNQTEVHQDGSHNEHQHGHIDPATTTAEIRVVLVPSELVVGPNRFAVGMFDSNGSMIHEGVVHFHYFELDNPEAPQLESTAQATRLQTPDGLTSIFAHERTFARPGEWGVEVQLHLPDGTAAVKRIGFQVLADSPSLKPGDTAPILKTLTTADVNGDLSQLTSALKPNPALHQMSLAEALANGKPTVLLLATPAFCQTRFCGPAYEIVSQVQESWGDTANFVQVEVYTGLPNPAANNWEMAPAMAAFGLHTEPWVFLIDREGTIVHRVEGLVTVQEIETHLRRWGD